MMTDRIHARIDPELKNNVSAILKSLGLSESDAIRMFYQQIEINRGIPFEIKLPNKETLDAIDELTHHKDKLRHYKTFEEFEASLK